VLTPAELRERQNAARIRWGLPPLAAIVGGIAGMAVGAEHVARQAPAVTAEALRQADELVTGTHEQRLQGIRRGIRLRSASVQARPTSPIPVGTPRNALVYDFEIDRLQRQLKRVPDAEKPAITRQIAQLERLKALRPLPIARRATTRTTTRKAQQKLKNTIELSELFPDMDPEGTQAHVAELEQLANKPPADVSAHVAQQYRRGETKKQLQARISTAKKVVERRRTVLEQLLDRRTAVVREAVRQQAIHDVEAALRQRRIHAAGRGALIGAGLGLTAAGVAVIAEHVARAWHQAHLRRKARDLGKISGAGDLAKARQPDPEDQMSLGLAQTFREWIDRLLGKTDAPIAGMGDTIATAMAPGLVDAYAAGLTSPPITTEGVPPQRKIAFEFDALNPSVRRHMAEYALDRIREITAQQREAIRKAIMEGSVLQGINPNDVARVIRQSIGLTAYQQGVVQSFRVGLQQLDPRVLERKLRDQRYDRTVKRAIDTNTPLTEDQVNAMTDAYHRRMLALRARTIARTEALRATSYGGLARAQEVLDEHPDLDVTKRWLATDDDRTRDTHRELNGREVDGMTSHFITSHGNMIRWPLDETAVAEEVINCRCTLQFVFKAQRGQLVRVAA
jgi:hypothetical protein